MQPTRSHVTVLSDVCASKDGQARTAVRTLMNVVSGQMTARLTQFARTLQEALLARVLLDFSSVVIFVSVCHIYFMLSNEK